MTVVVVFAVAAGKFIMEQNKVNLQEQKCPGTEFFFHAIEMANDETTSELELESDFFSWKVVKRRERPQRRFTVSHSAPPAPPSTPTALSKDLDPLSELSLSPTDQQNNIFCTNANTNAGLTTNGNGSGNSIGNGHSVVVNNDDESRLGSLLYILDYAPKYKKKLKEQQRTDAELAELFKVVTITSSGAAGGSGGGRGKVTPSTSLCNECTPKTATAERCVSHSSRRIRRAELDSTQFRIHRNPRDSIRDLHDEDSLSAPEFEAASEENMAAARRWRRLKGMGTRRVSSRRERLLRRFEQAKRMDEVVESFDSTMSFQTAQ